MGWTLAALAPGGGSETSESLDRPSSRKRWRAGLFAATAGEDALPTQRYKLQRSPTPDPPAAQSDSLNALEEERSMRATDAVREELDRCVERLIARTTGSSNDSLADVVVIG